MTAVATFRFDALEVARGADGLLRGKPEPVVLIAVFSVGEGRAVLRARHLVRFSTVRLIPVTLMPRETVRISATLDADEHAFGIAVLGVEEDSGDDVAYLYGALERPERFRAWPENDRVPDPVSLAECGRHAPRVPIPVHVMADSKNLEMLRRDDWVGASTSFVPGNARWTGDLRFSLLSADKKNDWTARVRAKVHTQLK